MCPEPDKEKPTYKTLDMQPSMQKGRKNQSQCTILERKDFDKRTTIQRIRRQRYKVYFPKQIIYH